MNFRLFYERYGGAEKERGIWYHGTSVDRISSIKSEGLVPEGKEKAWGSDPNRSFSTPDRSSLGGIYVTNNLMTALSAASQADRESMGHSALVVMELQPRTFIADEDDISRDLAKIPLSTGRIADSWNLSSITQYFFSKKYDIKELSDVEKSYEHYYDNFYKGLKISGIDIDDIHPEQKKRIDEILPRAYNAALKRAAAYAADKDSYENWQRPYDEIKSYANVSIPDDPPTPPSVGESEKDFREIVDQLTRTLKNLGRTVITGDKFNSTARVMEPIGFSGSNKILAILEIIPGRKMEELYGTEIDEDDKHDSFVRMRYGDRNDLPNEFYDTWKERRSKDGPKFFEDLTKNNQ